MQCDGTVCFASSHPPDAYDTIPHLKKKSPQRPLLVPIRPTRNYL